MPLKSTDNMEVVPYVLQVSLAATETYQNLHPEGPFVNQQ